MAVVREMRTRRVKMFMAGLWEALNAGSEAAWSILDAESRIYGCKVRRKR
jgi:hypothetical protein